MKLRKTTATLLIAIFMISTFVVAIPVNAYLVDDYKTAITAAADNLVDKQNGDGGFDWKYDGVSETSPGDNVLGITAMGILKAHELIDKTEYETSLAKAYKFAVDKPPTYVWNEEKQKWSEKVNDGGIPGVESYPDITFLTWLAEATKSDMTLLDAIINEVPGTTTASIAGLAKSRWDARVLHLGSLDPETPDGTATEMAEYFRDARHTQGYDALILWDLEAAVKAALALDSYFTGEGYDQQAIDIADVIYACVDDSGDMYFSSTDDSQEEYVLGLTGAIEAFTEVGLYTEKASELKELLVNIQQTDGSWMYYGATPVTMSVQSTAYAVMALLAQGDGNAREAAVKGSNWLISAQLTEDYWYAEGGTGDEYLEMDSEAAWALFSSILKRSFVPGKGKGLDKVIPNDNFAKSKGPGPQNGPNGPNRHANENAHEHANGNGGG